MECCFVVCPFWLEVKVGLFHPRDGCGFFGDPWDSVNNCGMLAEILSSKAAAHAAVSRLGCVSGNVDLKALLSSLLLGIHVKTLFSELPCGSFI